MQKRKMAFLAGIVLLILLAGWFIFSRINKDHTSAAADKTDIQVNAEKLYADFNANENQANETYLNKILEVKGKLINISQQSSQYVLMLNAAPTGGINCLMMDDAQKLSHLKINDDIIIKGKCSGFLMDVNLVDCVLIK